MSDAIDRFVNDVHQGDAAEHLAKNALPAAYVHYLARQWLESRDTRDAEEVQDNNGPAPREVPEGQASLLQPDGGWNTESLSTETNRSGGQR